MTPETFRRIRTAHFRTVPQCADYLRIADRRTIQRWENGSVSISGPAQIVMELIDAGTIKPYDTAHTKD